MTKTLTGSEPLGGQHLEHQRSLDVRRAVHEQQMSDAQHVRGRREPDIYACVCNFITFVWFCLVLFGFVWFCLVLFGFVWFCLVLFGFVWFVSCVFLQFTDLLCIFTHFLCINNHTQGHNIESYDYSIILQNPKSLSTCLEVPLTLTSFPFQNSPTLSPFRSPSYP